MGGAEHRNAGGALPVTNPADGQVFAEVAGGTAADVGAAVQSAARALADWSALAVAKRGEILGSAAHHVEQHVDELVPLLTREQGKTLRDARIEVTKAIDTLLHYAGLSKALRGAHTPNLDPGVEGYVLRRPLGVVGAIVPWNFPTTLLSNKLAPAVVAGNTVYLRGQIAQDLDTRASLHVGDAGKQADKAMSNIAMLLEEAGSELGHIVKVVIYLTDIRYREAVYRAMGKWLKGVFPVSTGLVVQALARPEWVVDIDATAVIPEGYKPKKKAKK